MNRITKIAVFFSGLFVFQLALASEDEALIYRRVIDSLDSSKRGDSQSLMSYHSAFIALSDIDSKEAVPLLIKCLNKK